MTSSKLGKVVSEQIVTDEIVELHKSVRTQGTLILGRSGKGKSGLVENLVQQDIEQEIGVVVFDPHGTLIHAIVSRIPPKREKDVIFLNPLDYQYPFSVNLYGCHDPTDPVQVQAAYEQIIHIYELLWGTGEAHSLGPEISQGLRNSAYLLLQNPGMTMAEVPDLFSHEAFCNRMLANLSHSLANQKVKQYWERYWSASDRIKDQLAAPTLNKVGEFLTNPLISHIVGQSETTIDFREIMESRPGKIVLVQLDTLNQNMTKLIGSALISQILFAAYARRDISEGKRKQVHIYTDEFQYFASADFGRIINELRKFSIGVTISHQYREQLPYQLRKATIAVENLIIFTVVPEDAAEMAKAFRLNPQRELIWQPMRVPQYETKTIRYWEPPESEQKYLEVQEKIKEIQQRMESPYDPSLLPMLRALNAVFNLISAYGLSPDEHSPVPEAFGDIYKELVQKIQMLETFSEEALLYNFYVYFNAHIQAYPIYATSANVEISQYVPSLPAVNSEKDIKAYFALEDIFFTLPSREISIAEKNSKVYITQLTPGSQEHEYASYLLKNVQQLLKPYRENPYHYIPEWSAISMYLSKNKEEYLKEKKKEAKAAQRSQIWLSILVVAITILLGFFHPLFWFIGGGVYLLLSLGMFIKERQRFSFLGLFANPLFSLDDGLPLSIQKFYEGHDEYDATWEKVTKKVEIQNHRAFDDHPNTVTILGRKHSGSYELYAYPRLKDYILEELKAWEPILINPIALFENERMRLQAELESLQLESLRLLEDKKERTEETFLGYWLETEISSTRSNSSSSRGRYYSDSESSSVTIRQRKWVQEPGHAEPFANTENRIKDDIIRLPEYHAKCRIKVATDDKDENGKPIFVIGEFIIKTFKPEKGISEDLLAERIARIQKWNREDGYCRSKTDVENEIANRQSLFKIPKFMSKPQQKTSQPEQKEPPKRPRRIE